MYPVFPQQYLVSFLPVQVKDVLHQQGVEQGKAEAFAECQTGEALSGMSSVVEEARLQAGIDTVEETLRLSDLRADIQDLQEALQSSLKDMMFALKEVCSVQAISSGAQLDPHAQRKAEIQAELEALQAELSQL